MQNNERKLKLQILDVTKYEDIKLAYYNKTDKLVRGIKNSDQRCKEIGSDD